MHLTMNALYAISIATMVLGLLFSVTKCRHDKSLCINSHDLTIAFGIGMLCALLAVDFFVKAA